MKYPTLAVNLSSLQRKYNKSMKTDYYVGKKVGEKLVFINEDGSYICHRKHTWFLKGSLENTKVLILSPSPRTGNRANSTS